MSSGSAIRASNLSGGRGDRRCPAAGDAERCSPQEVFVSISQSVQSGQSRIGSVKPWPPAGSSAPAAWWEAAKFNSIKAAPIRLARFTCLQPLDRSQCVVAERPPDSGPASWFSRDNSRWCPAASISSSEWLSSGASTRCVAISAPSPAVAVASPFAPDAADRSLRRARRWLAVPLTKACYRRPWRRLVVRKYVTQRRPAFTESVQFWGNIGELGALVAFIVVFLSAVFEICRSVMCEPRCCCQSYDIDVLRELALRAAGIDAAPSHVGHPSLLRHRLGSGSTSR